MITKKNTENEIRKFISLINEDYYHSYQSLFSKEDNTFKKYKFRCLKESIENPDKELYSLEENKKIKGSVSLKTLKWDSNIFNVPMGSIDDLYIKGNKSFHETGDKLLGYAKKRAKILGLKHLSSKVNTKHIEKIHLLENFGFRIMDTLLFFCFDRAASNNCENGDMETTYPKIFPIKEKDKNILVKTSKKIFSNYIGRFQADKKLSAKRAAKFYTEWVKNGCNGYEDFVFVSKENSDEITGFSMWMEEKKIRNETGKKIALLDLVGVNPEYKNRGIGCRLIQHGIATLKEFDFFFIPIHVDNTAMQRAAINAGARVVSSRYTLHLSLK